MVAGRGHSPPQSGLGYFRKCSRYLFLCSRWVPGGRRWPVRPRDERGGKQRFGGGWPGGGPGSIWGRGVDRGCVGRTPRGERAFSSQAPGLSSRGPGLGEWTPAWPASPSLPESPPRNGRSVGLTCVPSRVRVRACSSRINLGREGGDVASTHLGGRRRGARPRERGSQPTTARTELTRLLIDARLGFRSDWPGTFRPQG